MLSQRAPHGRLSQGDARSPLATEASTAALARAQELAEREAQLAEREARVAADAEALRRVSTEVDAARRAAVSSGS
jgi:hypothetical protein